MTSELQTFHSDVALQLHEELIKRYAGIQGVKSKGNVGFCIEQISTQFFNQDTTYPTIFMKAAALLHCITDSHVFIDGNKRSALLVTKFFMHINGYEFTNYTVDEMKNFMLSIASGKLNEITDIAE